MRITGSLVILIVLFRPLLPVFDYLFHYEYIVTEVCVNRDRPELECNGKCYLMRSLAEEAEREQDDKKGKLQERYASTLLYHEARQYGLVAEFVASGEITRIPVFCRCSYTFLFAEKPLRPPQFQVII